MASSSLVLSSEELETYRNTGVVRVRGIVTPQHLELLKTATEEAMEASRQSARNIAAEAGQRGRFHSDVGMWRQIPKFFEFLRSTRLAPVAAQLMNTTTVRLYNDNLWVKEPGTMTVTPWHQDAPYFKVAGDQAVSSWVAMDPVRKETGAVGYVRGSNAWGKTFRPVTFAKAASTEGASYFDGEIPDIGASPEQFDIVYYDLEPGDAVFFHFLTIHGAGGNASNMQRRRGYSVRMIGDSVRFADRPWTPYQIGAGLRDGDRLDDHADFPVLWGQST